MVLRIEEILLVSAYVLVHAVLYSEFLILQVWLWTLNVLLVSDDCLARGTKRKLSQRTLLDLNFSRESSKSEQTEVNGVQTSPDNDVNGTVNKSSDLVENDDSLIEMSNSRDHIQHTPAVASLESPVLNGKLNHKDDSPRASAQISRPQDAETVDEIYGYNLLTYIVARRFCDKVELNPGDTLSLMRDPSNAKDSNAIKVSYFITGIFN